MSTLIENWETLSNDHVNIPWLAQTLGMGKVRWTHIVTQESCPNLYTLLEDCRVKLGIRKPLRIVIYDPENGAKTACYNRLDGNIYFSKPCIEYFEQEQFRYAAGHEMGHAKYSRRQVLRVFGASGLSIASIELLKKIGIFPKEDNGIISSSDIFQIALTYVAVMAAVRMNEYEADRCAIDVIKDPKVIEAHYGLDEKDLGSIRDDGNITFFEIRALLSNIFGRHPSAADSIAAAWKYAKKKGYVDPKNSEQER